MPFKTKLVLAFWMILLSALCLPSYYTYKTLKDDLIKEAGERSLKQLELVQWLLETGRPYADITSLDSLCKDLGKRLGYRITLIAKNGRVIADSDVPSETIPLLDNHREREEVKQARKQGLGTSIRYSITVKRNLVYTAKEIDIPGVPASVLRVALPLSVLEARLAYFADRSWFLAALLFFAAALLSIFIAKRLEAPIRDIIAATRSIGEGNLKERVRIKSGPEFSQLASCINDMAQKMEEHIRRLRSQADELKAVFASMKEGVMVLDPDGRIKAVNLSLEKLAKKASSCIGRRPMEVFLNTELQKACDEVLAGAPNSSIKAAMDDGSIYEINLVSIPGGGAVAAFHDITELVRLERVRRDFVANVSHELRTPLTSIKGYSETLLEKGVADGETAKKFLSTIHHNAVQMSNIVEDLLELTKIERENGERMTEIRPVNPAKTFSAAWEICAPLAARKNMVMENRLDDCPDVLADEHALFLVFRNLLDNAVRYGPQNGKITVFCRNQKDMAVFCVKDDGPGIAAEHQGRIFERFYRVDKDRSRSAGGTGLGLSICRHAVMSMGGTIWVQSPPSQDEKGSVFCFSLKKAGQNSSKSKEH